MQILSIRCGLTRNLGNYESAKLVASAEIYAAKAKVQATIAVGFAILAVISAAGAALLMVLT